MLEGLPTNAAGTDVLRSILSRAAWVRMACGLGGMATNLWYFGLEDFRSWRVAGLLWFVGFTVLAPFGMFLAALRSRVALRGLEEPLDRDGTFGRWGRASIVDAFALVPWILAVAPSLIWSSDPYFLRRLFPLWIGLGFAIACGVMHVALLPGGLLRVDREQASRSGTVRILPTDDPVRLAFVPIARRKVICLTLTFLTFFLPWIPAGPAGGISTGLRPGRLPGPLGSEELLSGAGLLAGAGGDWAAYLTMQVLVAALVLLLAAAWECRRARWKGAPPWSQTRAFVSWCLLLALAAWPVYVGCTAGYRLLANRTPCFGYWACAVTLGAYVLHLIALTPLAAWRTLQSRSEAEREEELRDRGAETP